MSDERRVHAWFAENATLLDDVRVERTLSGREVRRRSAGRRRRRVLAAAVATVAVTSFAGVAGWNATRPERSAVEPSRPGESADMRRAHDTLRSYYSALPDAFASGGRAASSKLSKLMATHLTPTALRAEAIRKRTEAGSPAATCGEVTADTTFSVGGLRRTGADTVRARVVAKGGGGSGPVDVDFDIRVMKIAKWSCPEK
ncbi:hypothetical protein ACFZCY_03995 [Streptomyces sp. NPDC007983]|uniref:hypothetical protein n=1 Tax=Streptomyces sp. NPDC007983 TaxID=3364800 RepID=UPI0036E1C122